jgi:hypothetical protein
MTESVGVHDEREPERTGGRTGTRAEEGKYRNLGGATVIEAVREGAAPSYPSDAFEVDDAGVTALQPASMPQYTMPEMNGVYDPVVPEDLEDVYGMDVVRDRLEADQLKNEERRSKREAENFERANKKTQRKSTRESKNKSEEHQERQQEHSQHQRGNHPARSGNSGTEEKS